MARIVRILVLSCLFLTILAPRCLALTLNIRVVDARDGTRIVGAFVMVGPEKGNPFANNTGTTGPTGTIAFNDPAINRTEMVTAGKDGYAYFSALNTGEQTLQLELSPVVADTVIYGDKARVTGQVTNISTVDNDGKFDVALVMPALPLDQFIVGASALYEVPPDSADFPQIGRIPFPGNMVMPSQTEFFFLNFSKPIYKIDLPANSTQTIYSVSARIPIDVVLNPPPGFDALHYAQVREMGVERNKAVGTGLDLNINSDLNLTTNLTVRFEGVPNGDRITALSLGGIPNLGGVESIIGYDTDFGLADTVDSFLLASTNPTGDLNDVANLAVGLHGDSSAYLSYMSGRVDRSPVTLPATRTLRDFYAPPAITQEGWALSWNDVHTPGTEPDPTWSITEIRLLPIDPMDSTFVQHLYWRVVVAAQEQGFSLPTLPPEAPGPPGGVIDVDDTPEEDRLVWNVYVANPTGDLSDVLDRPTAGVTHFCQRRQNISDTPTSTPGDRIALAGKLRVTPNPARGPVRIDLVQPRGDAASITILDPAGRLVRRLVIPPGGSVWDGTDERGRTVPSGIYLLFREGVPGHAGSKVNVLR